MKTHNVAAIALAAAGLLWADAASANIVQLDKNALPTGGTYQDLVTVSGAGIYGVEIRGGKIGAAAAADWELGVGFHTSSPGNFNQSVNSAIVWPAGYVDFSMEWKTTGVTVTVNNTAPVSYSGLWQLGNAVSLYAKGTTSEFKDLVLNDGDESISNISFAGNNTFLLYGVDSGWTLSGKIKLQPGSGGSSNQLFVTMGNYTPPAVVPVPAALPIIGAALAGFGFAGWRQRKAA